MREQLFNELGLFFIFKIMITGVFRTFKDKLCCGRRYRFPRSLVEQPQSFYDSWQIQHRAPNRLAELASSTRRSKRMSFGWGKVLILPIRVKFVTVLSTLFFRRINRCIPNSIFLLIKVLLLQILVLFNSKWQFPKFIHVMYTIPVVIQP